MKAKTLKLQGKFIDECNTEKHTYEHNPICGVEICRDCGDHKGLARCFCGWNLSDERGDPEQALARWG